MKEKLEKDMKENKIIVHKNILALYGSGLRQVTITSKAKKTEKN